MASGAGASPIRSEAHEPAVTGDASVPGVAAWQRAADWARSRRNATWPTGVPSAAAPARRGRRPRPPCRPASATSSSTGCADALPNEGCGLLVSDRTPEDGGVPTRFVGMRNAAASPYRYLMDPDEQLRVMLEIDDADEVVWAIVHSHVASPPRPSATDVGLAAYPDALYVLCSFLGEPPELRAWTIVEGAVNEVVLERT